MNITKEATDEMNGILRVTLEPSDYHDKVEKSLEDYRKKVNLPGFRPGKAPAAMIRKKYYKSVLLDELNRVIQTSLTEYIKSSDLHILGQPLARAEEPVIGDFDNPGEFKFAFDLGMAPQFDITLSNSSFDYVQLKVTDELVDDEVMTLRRRFGTLSTVEEIGSGDLVYGEFAELEGGNIKEGGIKHSATIAMEYVNDAGAKQALLAKKKDETVDLDPRSVSTGDADLSAMLGISTDEVKTLTSKFRFTPTEIRRMNLSELNAEFFGKVYKDQVIADEAGLRAKIREDILRMYEHDSDRFLSNEVSRYLMDNTNIMLPENFLRRWFRATSESEKEATEFDAKFPEYMVGLKWQLIQNRLVKDNNISISKDEMNDFAKGMIARQYAQYGIHSPEPKLLDDHAKKVLSGAKEADQIYNNVMSRKLTDHFKNMVKLNIVELPIKEFMEKITGVPAGVK